MTKTIFHSTVRVAPKIASHANIRHQTLNWSGPSQGLKHPNGPVGLMLRDEGIVDIYAGAGRFLIGLDGSSLHLASYYHLASERTSFSTRGINNFRVLGKHFNEDIHKGQKILAVKPSVDISKYIIIGPDTEIISPEGPCVIVGPVKLSDIFEDKQLFLTPEDDELIPADAEIARYLTFLLGE